MRALRRAVNGVLLLDKPVGLSSTQAMAAAKRLFGAQKAGHTGTLDPFATGLLPVCFGEATKFARFMLDAEKSYRATICLGAVSSTGDTEGDITARPVLRLPERQQVETVLRGFVGPQAQMPPMTSALKVNGVPLYKLARRGEEVERASREITVHALRMVSLEAARLVVDADVSKGTYMRVLAADIGEALGCGAYLTQLRRTATGGFGIDDALTLGELESHAGPDRDALLRPTDALCLGLERVEVDTDDARIFSHGGWLDWTKDSGPAPTEIAVFKSGDFLGVGKLKMEGGRMRLVPERLMTRRTP
jgi:tRNA pseudouridine55 synthase